MAFQSDHSGAAVPTLLRRLAGLCCPGHSGARARAFAILLKYDEVAYPTNDISSRSKANSERLSEVCLGLMERSRHEGTSRLEQLCATLRGCSETLLLPPGVDAGALGHVGQADILPVQEHDAVVSLLLALKDAEAERQYSTSLPAQPSTPPLVPPLAPGSSCLGLWPALGDFQQLPSACEGLMETAPEGHRKTSLWAMPIPDGLQYPCRPPEAGHQDQRPLYTVEEPDSMRMSSSTLGASMSEAHHDVSIHTMNDTAASLSASMQEPFPHGSGNPQADRSHSGHPRLSVAALAAAQQAARVGFSIPEEALPGTGTCFLGTRVAEPAPSSFLCPIGSDQSSQLLKEDLGGGSSKYKAAAAPAEELSRPAGSASAIMKGSGQQPSRQPQGVGRSGAHEVSEEDLVRAVVLCMQGVEASLLQISTGSIATGTLGPRATASLLSEAAATGARFLRLCACVAQFGLSGPQGTDPIRAALVHAVEEFLFQHVAALQALQSAVQMRRHSERPGHGKPGGTAIPLTLLEVVLQTNRLQARLHSLSVGSQVPEWEEIGFPAGASLLEYLHDQLCEAQWSTAPLLRLLFASAFGPYMDHIRGWLFTTLPMGIAWSSSDGAHLSGLGHVRHAVASPSGLPSALPAFLSAVQREFLLAGLQLRLLSSLPDNRQLALRMRQSAEMEAQEASYVAGGRSSGLAAGPAQQMGSGWFAPGGSMPLVFRAQSLRSLCSLQQEAAKERANEAAEAMEALAGRRRLVSAAAERETLASAQKRSEARATARASKAKEAAKRRARQRVMLQAQQAAITEKQSRDKALREAVIREEQELLEGVVRAERANILAEMASKQEADALAMAEMDRRTKQLEWRSARWRLSARRRRFLLDQEAGWAAEMIEALTRRPRRVAPDSPASTSPGARGPDPAEDPTGPAAGLAQTSTAEDLGHGSSAQSGHRRPQVWRARARHPGLAVQSSLVPSDSAVSLDKKDLAPVVSTPGGSGLPGIGVQQQLPEGDALPKVQPGPPPDDVLSIGTAGVEVPSPSHPQPAAESEPGTDGAVVELADIQLEDVLVPSVSSPTQQAFRTTWAAPVESRLPNLEALASEASSVTESAFAYERDDPEKNQDTAPELQANTLQGPSVIEGPAGRRTWGQPEGSAAPATEPQAPDRAAWNTDGMASPMIPERSQGERRQWQDSRMETRADPGIASTVRKSSFHEYEDGALPPQAALDACLVRGLLAQYRCISHATLRFFREEFQLDRYFEALGSIFFLQNSDFSLQLLDSLADLAASHQPLSEVEAKSILDAALRDSSADLSVLEGTLTLDVQPRRSLSTAPAKAMGDSQRGLGNALLLREERLSGMDGVVLQHTPRWPLTVVVSPNSLEAYSDVASMLLRYHRVTSALSKLWKPLKDASMVRRGAIPSDAEGSCGWEEVQRRLRQLQLFRHEAEHFANNLQGYIHTQLQGPVWSQFQTRLAQAQDICDIARAHESFTASAAATCLLTSRTKKVRTAVDNAFQKLLDLRSILSKSENMLPTLASHTGWSECSRAMADFRSCSGLLLKLLQATAGRGGHMSNLLHSFELNSYYNRMARSQSQPLARTR